MDESDRTTDRRAQALHAEHDRQLVRDVLALTPAQRLDELDAFFAIARPVPQD